MITTGGAALYHNNKGKFEKSPMKLPAGHFAKAVWLDFDHDYDLDLILLGENAALARNNGEAGFSDDTAAFPFVKGSAIDAAAIDLIADTNGVDLAVSYRDRAGVLYRDRLLGKYEAEPLDTLPAGAKGLAAFDVNNDSWTDLAADGLLLLNHQGKLEPLAGLEAKGPLTFADLANRGIGDLLAANGVFRNLGLDHFEKTPAAIPRRGRRRGSRISMAMAAPTVALIAGDGALHLLRNATETHNNWLLAGLNGVKNLEAGALREGRDQDRRQLSEADLSRRAAAVRPGFLQDRRHRAHHLAQRPDPERNQAAREPRPSNTRSAAPVRLLPHDLHLERQRLPVPHRRAGRGAAGRELRATASISRWITTSTCRSPAKRCRPRDGQLRDPHHRGTARGLLSRSGPS